MNKLSEFLEKRLLPVATWVAQNEYLQTLSQVFISLLPVIMVGAFSLIIAKSPVNYTGFTEGTYWYNFFKTWTDWTNANLQPLKFVTSATLGSLSLWVSAGIAFRWAKKYDLEIFTTIIVVVVSFLLINSVKVDATWSVQYFGGEGLFSAIIFSFIFVQIYKNLVTKGIGKFEFPPTVPASLSRSINNLLPMAITLFTAALITGLVQLKLQMTIPALILKVGAPLNLAINNPLSMGLVSVFGQIAWWFGIHNSAVFSVVSPLLYSNLGANAEAYMAGTAATQLPWIVNQSFFYSFCAIGGSGATFSLVLWLLRSKSEGLKTVGRLSIIPACFGINEPVIFGLPIVMNVTLLIPFLFVQVVNVFIAYYAMSFGLLNKAMFYMGGTAPEIVKAVLSNMDLRSIAYWFVVVIVDAALWYPFFKVFEKQKLAEESAVKA